MIVLSESARSRFAHLATPPTHAYCNWRSVSHAPGIAGVTNIQTGYIFGTLDADGNFIVNAHCGTFSASLPKRGKAAKDNSEQELWKTLLANLFAVGAVPHPEDATKTIPVAAKRDRADCKVCDIDAVMSHAYPELNGTIVPYSGAM